MAAAAGRTLGESSNDDENHELTLEDALLDTDESGRTPLHLATRFDYLDCVHVILDAAARGGSELFKEVVGAMDGEEGQGGTPLYVALRRGNSKVIIVSNRDRERIKQGGLYIYLRLLLCFYIGRLYRGAGILYLFCLMFDIIAILFCWVCYSS